MAKDGRVVEGGSDEIPRAKGALGMTRRGGQDLGGALSGIRDALIIHNPAAGRRRRRRSRDIAEARRILSEAGIDTELAETASPGHTVEFARQAARDGRGLVIACGGDGTIHEIANGLAGSRVPLAILPAGTANVLAKELELPWNIPAAARRIPRSRLARIALGVAQQDPPNGPCRYFVCLAGAGIDGSMVYRTSSLLKAATGQFAYWVEGLRHLFGYPMLPFSVDAGGHEFQATQVIVGRTKNFGGPFRITTGADFFGDRFQAAVFTARSRFRYPAILLATWRNRLERRSDVYFVETAQVRCTAAPGTEIYVETDGEAAGKLPMEFRVAPDALTLVVPENETETALRNVL
jgi:diacylglycerol kinase (ATP)